MLGLNCPEKIFYYALYFLCGLFAALGVGLIVVGAVVISRTSGYNELIEGGFLSIPALILVLGVFVAVLFSFGCYGLKRQSYCMAMTFAVLLSIILLMEIIGGISAYMLRGQTEQAFQQTLNSSFRQYNNNSNPDVSKLWDTIQTNLQCCGVNNSTDYSQLVPPQAIPFSCCKTADNCTTSDPNNVYQNGCGTKMEEILVNSIGLITKWFLIVGLFHLIWIIGVCYYAVRFRQLRYETV